MQQYLCHFTHDPVLCLLLLCHCWYTKRIISTRNVSFSPTKKEYMKCFYLYVLLIKKQGFLNSYIPLNNAQINHIQILIWQEFPLWVLMVVTQVKGQFLSSFSAVLTLIIFFFSVNPMSCGEISFKLPSKCIINFCIM